MDISINEYRSDANRMESFYFWIKIVTGIAGRLVGFFYLTEEDRVKAGIYVSDDDHDG